MANETPPEGQPAEPVMDLSSFKSPSATPEEHRRMELDFTAYRRELPRLLDEGHANRYVVIHDGQVVSIWDTQNDAIQAACERFGLGMFSINKVNPLDVKRFPLLDALIAARKASCQR